MKKKVRRKWKDDQKRNHVKKFKSLEKNRIRNERKDEKGRKTKESKWRKRKEKEDQSRRSNMEEREEIKGKEKYVENDAKWKCQDDITSCVAPNSDDSHGCVKLWCNNGRKKT